MSIRPLQSRSLSTILRRAQSLDERLERDSGDGTPRSDLIEEWLRLVAAGDREAFRRRLEWDGLDEATVAARLADSPEAAPETEWGAILEEVCERCDELAGELDEGTVPEETALFAAGELPPFALLWIPALRVALDHLPSATIGPLLQAAAVDDIRRHLVRQLASLGELAIYRELDAFRRSAGPSVDDTSDSHLFDRFVSQLLRTRMIPLFEEYPALARQAAQLTMHWIGHWSELLERFEADREEIARRFSTDPKTGIKSFRTGLSDRHHGGRQVTALRLTSGTELIYNPRDVGMARSYNDLLRWLAQRGLEDPPRAIEVIECDGYGWIELVEHEAVASHDEASGYFTRSGMLLCLAYLLEASDLHMDNVIATRRGPVLIDVESLVQPLRADHSAPATGAMEQARQRIRRSVLSSGLLRFAQADEEGNVYDIGGLRGRGGYVSTKYARTWVLANRDGMHPEYGPRVAEPMQNVLRLNGEIQMPEDYVDELADGFERMYRFVLDHRGEITSEGGPLEKFRTRRSRLILRPSNIYGFLLYKLASPDYQRDGVRRGLLIDSLNRAFRHSRERPLLWPLVRTERQSLEQLDVPLFTVPVEELTIRSHGAEPISGFLRRSGFDAVLDQLAGMGEADLKMQLELLRASLLPLEREAQVLEESEIEASVGPPLSPETLLEQAEQLGREILENAITGSDDAITWIAPSYLRLDERSDRGVSYYLYDGAAGIALFLAALGVVTGDRSYREAAMAATMPLRAVLGSGETDLLFLREGIGICNGIGSLVYALCVLGILHGDGESFERAIALSALITPERIDGDERLDLEGGSAGAILGLLALHAVTGDREVLSRATDCGRHLLRAARPAAGGGVGWVSPGGAMLAGMAHGASGIGLALARLYEQTGEEEFADAARGAFRYESAVYDAEAGNWPIVQPGEPEAGAPLFMTAWCHGAPGIALARLGISGIIDGEERSLEQALETTLRSGLSPLDHLCCGNLGRAEVLLTASRRLKRESLRDSALARTATVLRRRQSSGRFGLRASAAENRSFQPGFFRGISGVGYTLLRLIDPARIPSILLFDLPERGNGGD